SASMPKRMCRPRPPAIPRLGGRSGGVTRAGSGRCGQDKLWAGVHERGAVSVLDNCRISWGKVLSVDAATATVYCRPLVWDGDGRALTPPIVRHVTGSTEECTGLPEPAPCQHVAIHWGRVCGRDSETTDQSRPLTARPRSRLRE